MRFADASTFSDAPCGYKVLRELGSGGLARVCLAVAKDSVETRTPVVIKFLKSHLARSLELRSAFLEGARLWARIAHPNVVCAKELVEQTVSPMLVLEYLEGYPLSAMLQRRLRKADIATMLRLFSQCLSGLEHAHELRDTSFTRPRIVHCNFSPGNIIVQRNGQVKLLNLGIAQVSHSPEFLWLNRSRSKMHYMSPEQIIGSSLDCRVDVFAAGIVLSEIVTGQRFWSNRSDQEIIRSIRCGDIPTPRSLNPRCPIELERICTKALEFDRDRRHESIGALQQELEDYLEMLSEDSTTRVRQRADSYVNEREPIRRVNTR